MESGHPLPPCITAFAFQNVKKTKLEQNPLKMQELVWSKKLNLRVLNTGVLSLGFTLKIWGPQLITRVLLVSVSP